MAAPLPSGLVYDLTKSICPRCRRLIDAEILFREDKVYMRKSCPDHGAFEALIYADAALYLKALRDNTPGTPPLKFSAETKEGCPYDCGLCPEHQQHTCLGIIEVNTDCNLACPICFADAGPGYNLTLGQVETMLDRFVECEGEPEVLQFSGGEPTIHPEILNMLRAAKARRIRAVMLNTNGVRLAKDRRFLFQLIELCPSIYLQFDGLQRATSRTIRGQDLVRDKLGALDNLAAVGLNAVLVAAIERGVNEHEIGPIVRFGLEHPAVRGIVFQPVTHVGRHLPFHPLERMTIPDVIHDLEVQTEGLFRVADFIPVPCCTPTCSSVTYAYVEGGRVTPLPRVLNVNDYLDSIANRTLPDLSLDIQGAILCGCGSCGPQPSGEPAGLRERLFMIMVKDFMDAYTFNLKSLVKCCVEVLTPDGRMIPFCAYNTMGYREQVRAQLSSAGRR